MVEGKKISLEAEEKLREIQARYPQSRSAVMSALYLVQEEHGLITPEGIRWVAQKLNVSPVQVEEIASFYTMYHKKPVGKYHIQICRTLSCMLRGAPQIKQFIEQRLGLKSGEVSEDGLWSFEEVECLGSCGTAPVVQINDLFIENLTVEKLSAVLDRIEVEQPDLSFSTFRESLGLGLKDEPRSQIFQRQEPD